MNSTKMSDIWFDRIFDLIVGVVKASFTMMECVFRGLTSFRTPLYWIFMGSVLGYMTVSTSFDITVWSWVGLPEYAPVEGTSLLYYTAFLSTLGVWSWLVVAGFKFLRYQSKWHRFIVDANLKTLTGHKPKLLKVKECSDGAYELYIHLAGISKGVLEAKKNTFAGVFGAGLDRINSDVDGRRCKITYSFAKIPAQYEFPKVSRLKGCRYLAGQSRSEKIINDFRASPHLLVAGQTGGGKSTFLRQLIYSNFVARDRPDLLLIDLKEGLEFQSFENLKGVTIVSNSNAAAEAMKTLTNELQFRLKCIRRAKAKDIDSYNKQSISQGTKPRKFARKIVVIDEVAEAVLSSPSNSPANAMANQSSISQIARLGRAAGIHLVLATQRPDAQCLSGQIRSNMSSRVCFKMPDISSSIIVLSNKSGYEIPAIAGRAIMQDGLRRVEVQTPFLSAETLDSLLVSHRIEKSATEESPIHTDEGTDCNDSSGGIEI